MINIFYFGMILIFLNGLLIIILRKNLIYFLIGSILSFSSLSFLFFLTSRILGNPYGEVYALLLFPLNLILIAIALSIVVKLNG